MATYYIDFENGNDANAGTSFATRWKTITNGAAAARIAPGDEIRIMASPDPTSIGNATWTGGGRQAAINIASSTNATPIVITTSAAHGLVPGDYVMISGHTINSNANGIWKVGTTPTSTTFQILQIDGSNTTGNGTGIATGDVTNIDNCIVKTATPLVRNIALCGGLGQKPAWTASTNVTTSATAIIYKEGYTSASIAVGASFTTGKAAYYTLPATLDLSAYQRVSFWATQSSGTLGAAGQTYVALCSDTIGNTVVHQCPVPALGALSAWVPVTIDLGTNLSATIRSVAFYVVTDLGAQTFFLDNIIACKASSAADSISLQSLLSKSNGTGDEAWYAIQSINYDAIMLANGNNISSTNGSIRGYAGTSETVTTYKRETIKTAVASSGTASVSLINDSGTAGNLITYSGGWNRTDMSTQTGRTWLDGLNGQGVGIQANGAGNGNYVSLDRIDVCRYASGILATVSGQNNFTVTSAYIVACTTLGLHLGGTTSYNNTLGDVWVNGCVGNITINGSGHTVTNLRTLASAGTNSGISIAGCYYLYIANLSSINNGIAGVSAGTSTNCTFGTVSISLNDTSGISATGGSYFVNGGTISSNRNNGVASNSGGSVYLNNVTINETTETAAGVSGTIYANRLDDADGNNWVFQGFGTVNQQTVVVDSPATTAWQMRPTNVAASATAPIRLKLGTVVCAANTLVTVTARMRRDDTGLTMRLVCPGGQISGVSSDVTSDMTAAANTWETVTITFTPTKPGGVDIYAYAFGGTTYSGYVCNLTASQA